MHLAPPVPPRSPTGVRFACALLYGVAGLCLLSAVLELVFVNTDLSVYRDAYTGDPGSGFGSLVIATLDIFFAGGAAVLAVLNGQGRRYARITTYVLGGISLLCGGLGALSDPFHGPSHPAGSGAADHVMPAVYGLSAGALDVLTALAILAVLVLLAVPSSSHYFETCHRNRYVLIVTTPPPPGVPVQRDLPPHTGSLPPIDPWAGPGGG
ncbi:hypothetical protein ACPCHT_02510 [Nucisporomicrobium flavum]|uniref:hypothetical protein n=1 Tax=Nucisporomicrobium flavum TaxID=2785915 RepID=UPI003C2F8F13